MSLSGRCRRYIEFRLSGRPRNIERRYCVHEHLMIQRREVGMLVLTIMLCHLYFVINSGALEWLECGQINQDDSYRVLSDSQAD